MIRGYKVETCFASSGCPRRTGETETLAARLESCLVQRDILSFLKKRIRGSLRTHHEFRVAIAGCPNGCTQPQIRDMGILALCRPRVADMDCSRCGHCIHACPDKALSLDTEGIHIQEDRCMHCGLCITTCRDGGLLAAEKGFRVLLGGRLGRHPRLGLPLPDLYSAEDLEKILSLVLDFWMSRPDPMERFSRMLQPEDLHIFLP